MRPKHFEIRHAALGAALLLFSTPVFAAVTTVTATGGSIGDNVINNVCSTNTSSGAVVTGCLNSNHNSIIDFYSNENVAFGAGGQAVVAAVDGAMGTITIDPLSFALSELIVNVNANANGFAQFCDNTGCFGSLLAINNDGSNFFDVTFNPNADFLTINTFLNSNATGSAQLIADTRQWRVAGGASVAVPEPASLAVLGAGLFVMGWYLRQRGRKGPGA